MSRACGKADVSVWAIVLIPEEHRKRMEVPLVRLVEIRAYPVGSLIFSRRVDPALACGWQLGLPAAVVK